MLIDSGVGCYIDNVGVNHVFHANKPHVCTMVLCAIALKVILNIYLKNMVTVHRQSKLFLLGTHFK